MYRLIKKWFSKLFCKEETKEEEDMLRNSIIGAGGSGGAFSLYNYTYNPSKSKTDISSLGIPDFWKHSSTGLFVKPDGTKCWTANENRPQYEFTLSTPWDFSTITKTYSRIGIPFQNGDNSTDVWGQGKVGVGPVFDSTGTRCFICESEVYKRVNQYSTATPWSINGMVKVDSNVECDQLLDTNGDAHGFMVKPDGSAWYSLLDNRGKAKVITVNMSIPFQCDTGVVADPEGVVVAEKDPLSRPPSGWWLGPEGTLLVITYRNPGVASAILTSYQLETAYDFSTAELIEVWEPPSTNNSVYGVSFSDDMKKMVLLTALIPTDSESAFHLYEK